MNPTVAIVILNFNGKDNTLECLESIQELRITNYELRIVVVDNGSDEEFRVQPSEFRINELKIIRNQKNLGFSGGNNVGIRYALENGADYVLILNNDTLVEKNLVDRLLGVAGNDDRIGIVAPKIYFAKGYEFHKDRYKNEELGSVVWYAGGIMDWANIIGYHRGVDEVDAGQYEKTEETNFASGCCMLVKKEVFENVAPPAGGFDERYYLYYEDADFCERVKRAGYKILFTPKAILWHKNAGSAGGSGSNLQDYYITRNRLLFGMRFAPLRSKGALIRQSLGLFIDGRAWQKRGALDFYLGRFGKGSYPI